MIDGDFWDREIRHLSESLVETHADGDATSNGLASAATMEDLASLKARFSSRDLTQLLAFYGRCDGASFPDLWNGYYIHPIRLLLRVGEDIPVRVEGSLTREILPFGSDGGGNLFASSLGQEMDILLLPHGAIRGSIYRDTSAMPMTVVAKDFDGFLRRLLEDLKAFVNGTPGWRYMDGRAQ
jgi:hypothetical protein